MQAAIETTTSRNLPVDPRLAPVVDYMSRRIAIAFEKAAAHQSDPRTYPLPLDRHAMEAVLAERLAELPPLRQRAAIAAMMAQVSAPKSAREARLGELARLDLRSPVSLGRQARALGVLPRSSFTRADLPEILKRALAASALKPASGGAPASSLELRIHQVKCVEDTREAGKDEISVGGVLTDFATGATTPVQPLDLGKFAKGDVKKFDNPVRLPAFSLQEGENFPKSYLAVVALSEIDFGGFSEFLNKLLDGLADELNVIVGLLVASIAAGAAAGSVLPAIGTIVGLVAGAVIGILFAFLKQVFADDIFPPETVTPVVLGSLTDRFAGNSLDSPPEVLVYLGFGGHYELTVSWHLA